MKTLWKGSLSFGLVNIPIRLGSGSVEKQVSFRMLHAKDRSEISYARICKKEGTEVPWDEIVKGYEYEKGKYIILTEKDFDKLDIEANRSIEIMEFVNEAEIDPIYFNKPYFLQAEKDAAKPYLVLKEALKKAKKVGIAKYVLRHHEHIAIVRVFEDTLILNQLRYRAEIRSTKELSLETKEKATKLEVNMAVELIKQMTKPFNPKVFKNTYEEKLKKMIKAKPKGKGTFKEAKTAKKTRTSDLSTALKASLRKKPSNRKSI